MSYTKFKPDVWATEYQKENERLSVFTKNTYRKYEGLVKKAGDVVTIPFLNSPTVITKSDGTVGKLPEPEIIADTSAKMPINYTSIVNFLVEDIDEAQTNDGLLSDLMKAAAVKTASEVDKHIAEIARDPLAEFQNSTATKVTTDNVLDMIDAATQYMWEKDVPSNETLYMTVTPRFYRILRRAMVAIDTDNSELLKSGYLTQYSSVKIDESNNIATNDSGATDLIMMRTDKAIAFAQPKTVLKPYDHSDYIGDAVKGYTLYGTKLIRPKELAVLNVKYV